MFAAKRGFEAKIFVQRSRRSLAQSKTSKGSIGPLDDHELQIGSRDLRRPQDQTRDANNDE